MNFLKISGLIIGTGSAAGGTGIGIYYSYSVNKNIKNTSDNLKTDIVNEKTPSFDGIIDSSNGNYEQINNEDIENSSIIAKNDPIIVQRIVDNKKIKNIKQEKLRFKSDKNFDGKIIFYKKLGKENNVTYEARLIDNNEYKKQKNAFNKSKIDYDKVNKVIDISGNLNSEKIRAKLKKIFVTTSLLSDIKAKIISSEKELKKLLGEEIYAKLEAVI